jgi:hypothetical protein
MSKALIILLLAITLIGVRRSEARAGENGSNLRFHVTSVTANRDIWLHSAEFDQVPWLMFVPLRVGTATSWQDTRSTTWRDFFCSLPLRQPRPCQPGERSRKVG